MFLKPLLRSTQPHAIHNLRTGLIVADQVHTAFDSKSRRTGLLRRGSLPDGFALVIAPCGAIHTFFMRFAIDVAFVSREGRVLKTQARVAPWRIAASLRAFAVVELPAGALDRSGTARGDVLAVVPA